MTLDIYSIGGTACLLLAGLIALAQPVMTWIQDGAPRGLDEDTEVWHG